MENEIIKKMVLEVNGKTIELTMDQANTLYRDAFISLWQSINGKKHQWDSNPWVWVISFRVA